MTNYLHSITIIGMAKKYYTASEVRKEFMGFARMATQAEFARLIGINPAVISMIISGRAINGKVLAWLGFRRVTMYERIPK